MEQVKTPPTEAELKALEGFKEIIVETGKEAFLEDGYMSPMIFIGQDTPDGKIAYIAMEAQEFMKNTESKNKLSALMKKICTVEPLCICLSTEAWVVRMDGKDKSKQEMDGLMNIVPSEHPDRVEILMFSFESENMHKMISYEIIRDGEKFTIKEMEGTDEVDSGKGRFAGMLRDLKKTKWN